MGVKLDLTELTEIAARAAHEEYAGANRVLGIAIPDWDDLEPACKHEMREMVLPIVTAIAGSDSVAFILEDVWDEGWSAGRWWSAGGDPPKNPYAV